MPVVCRILRIRWKETLKIKFMEDQEINKQLKSQNLKGKIALILGIINLSLLLVTLPILFSNYFYIFHGVLLQIFSLSVYVTLLGGTFLIAVIGIIFGFLGRKTMKGKVGIILNIISLVSFIVVWCFLKEI
jgi:hypothetical protein